MNSICLKDFDFYNDVLSIWNRKLECLESMNDMHACGEAETKCKLSWVMYVI